MGLSTDLSRRLGIKFAIIQAPMGGGASTPSLVAAVSEAGALGFIGAAYLTPELIEENAAAVRQRTSRPFGINIFAPVPLPKMPADIKPALAHLAPFHAALDLPSPQAPAAPKDPFANLMPAVLESGAAVFSFTFGIPPADAIDAVKAKGMFVMGTATTVDEALALENAGVDAVVAQGSEAGAHRGTFAAAFESAMIGTVALVPQVADSVNLPVIASGGIMDGRGIAAAVALGAEGVQMGTAFLTCEESGIPDAYKAAILAAGEDETRITRAFSGRPARGIENLFIRETDDQTVSGAVLPYPLQNTLTRPMRTAAGQAGNAAYLSLWAGQGVRLSRRGTAADLIHRLVDETGAAATRLQNAVV